MYITIIFDLFIIALYEKIKMKKPKGHLLSLIICLCIMTSIIIIIPITAGAYYDDYYFDGYYGSSHFTEGPYSDYFYSGDIYCTSDKSIIFMLDGNGAKIIDVAETIDYVPDFVSIPNLDQGYADTYAVTSIADGAFYNCKNIREICLPYIDSIGECAFYGCTNLNSIEIDASYLFYIGNWAFYGCSNLETMNIPDTVYTMGDYVLYDTAVYNNYENWENNCFYLSNWLIGVNDDAVGHSFEIKDGTYGIACYISPNSIIEEVTIPECVDEITFEGLFGLSSIKDIYYYGEEKDWGEISIIFYQDGYWSMCSMSEYLSGSLDYGPTEIFDDTVIHYIPSTKTNFKNGVFTVTTRNIPIGSSIIFLCYNGNEITDVQSKIYEDFTLQFTTTEAYDAIKILVWKSLSSLEPITEAEIIGN